MRRLIYATFLGVVSLTLLLDCGKDPSPTWSIYYLGSYTPEGPVSSVFVVADFAYILEPFSLDIIDVTNPEDPTFTGRFETQTWGQTAKVHVVGDHAYLAAVAINGGGLLVVNISQPTDPVLTGFCETPGRAFGIYVAGRFAYIADGPSGLQIINVEDPASPNLTGSYDMPGFAMAHSVNVEGNYAYVLFQLTWDFPVSWTLQIIDVSDPAAPTLAGSYEAPGSAGNVFVAGNYAYVADIHYDDDILSDGGLKILNISNPYGPEHAGSYYVFGGAQQVFIKENIAYLPERYLETNDTGLYVLWVANPSSPRLLTSDVPSISTNRFGIFVQGDYIYIADGDQGLLIFRCALLWPI